VDNIVRAAQAIDSRVYLLFGGLHHIKADDAEVSRLTSALHDEFKVERIAPGHCSGEPQFAALKRAFGNRYVYAGLGTVVELP